MSNNKENNKEKMGMNDEIQAKTAKYDYGEIEKKVDELDKKINTPIDEGDKDQEEPLTTVGRKIDRMLIRPERMSMRPPLTTEEKIQLIGCLFPIELGCHIKNKHNEEGFVEMVGIDHRGALYLVAYKDQNVRWETEAQIKRISYTGPFRKAQDSFASEFPSEPKTDIPDPKKQQHVVGNRESELE